MASLAYELRLDSDFVPGGADAGVLTLTLINTGTRTFSGFRLAFTALLRVRNDRAPAGGSIVEQLANYVVIAPVAGTTLVPGARWQVSFDGLGDRIRHYSYGPKSAYIILADGSTVTAEVAPMTREGVPGSPLLERTAPPPMAAGAAPVVPMPLEAGVSGQRPADDAIWLAAGPPEARAAFDAVAALAGRLFAAGPPLFAKGGDIGVAGIVEPMDGEGYRIAFALDRIDVAAGSRAGFQHAFVTLGQWLRAARRNPERLAFPATGAVADAPRFGWRGFHLDVARQVYRPVEILRALDRMAWLKLNRFHIHLTDDEGWRLDIPGYPQLAEIAAWRGHGLAVPPLLGSPLEREGLVYARGDLAAIVRRAEELGIVVVPEIDVPGHCYAPLTALPQLRDPGETGIYRSVQGFPNNALNPAVAETWHFLEAVFGEVAAIFPGPWIHVGGDEVADDAWLGSPLALKLIRDRGWNGVAELRSHFLQRCQHIVRELKRGVAGWQEAAHGGGIDTDDTYLVAWRDAASGLALARQGYDVVMAPAPAYYFDMAQADDWWEPGAAWSGTVPPETTYAYEPGEDWGEDERARILGVQACLWSENLHDRRLFDHLTFPRLAALAETGWTPRGRKNFSPFAALAPVLFD